MLRFYKPARGKDIHQRGYFSYITESVVHLHNLHLNNSDEEIILYHDLCDIRGYGKGNMFDTCFTQDKNDYITHKDQYSDIEKVNYITTLDAYNPKTFNQKDIEITESIIKKYFILNDEMKKIFSSRHSEIDFSKTIGFHRRSTDMEIVHHVKKIELNNIFTILEKEDFENIFLMCDNIKDLEEFKNRYGNRLITFDDMTTSKESSEPFFKIGNEEDLVKKHIQEIVFGAFTLGMTKKLICTKSNLSSFSIFSNSKLNYTILN